MKSRHLLLIVLSIFSLFLLSFLNYEYTNTVNKYLEEKINDLNIYYDDKLYSSEEYVNEILNSMMQDNKVLDIYRKISLTTDKSQLFQLRNQLFSNLEEKYQKMKNKGILQLHFHLPDGTSFLRMHNPNKFGDNLLDFRYTVQKVINTKKIVVGFELGKYFEGFRYIFPIFDNQKYLGSVELSLSSQKFISNMNKYLKGNFVMILKKSYADSIIEKEIIKKNFHTTCFSNKYYMNNMIHDSKKLNRDVIKSAKEKYINKLEEGKTFAVYNIELFKGSYIFVFKSLVNFKNEHIGYSMQILKDNTIQSILIDTFIKLILMIMAYILIVYFYKKNQKSENFLKQFKNFVDRTTLVSKTDLNGKINYVNEEFVKVAGYSREELMGKPHNIVRDPTVPKRIFKNLWETLKKGKVWKGKISNRRKDGTLYSVDAKIFPIFNEKNEVVEYISLRHDITELEAYKKVLEKRLDSSEKSLENNISLVKQYQDAIESASAFMRINLDGVITYVNETMLEISKMQKEEITDISIVELGLVSKQTFEDIKEKLLAKEKWSGVIECKHDRKKSCYIDAVFSPILQNNSVVEFICISHDVTPIYDLYTEIENTQKEVVFTMGAIGESRSKETGHHVKRVAEYSLVLAQLAGLKQKECELLRQASPMHDIGKVGIPDSILHKPGKLDEKEWKIMKTHSKLGYNMLKHSQRDILKTAAIVAHEHHEKWNGKGYPKGLAGEKIHIYGRITAIADVFDALGSDRCYKKAWKLDKIIELFQEERGQSFDPNLVDLFLGNIEKFLEIRSKYIDVIEDDSE